MSHQTPTFAEYLASKYYHQITEKGFLGKTRIRYGPWTVASSFIHQTGALIGRARRGVLVQLARTLAQPGQEQTVAANLKEFGEGRLRILPDPHCTFFEFFLVTDLQCSAEEAFAEFADLSQREVPRDDAYPKMQFAAVEGIGLGAYHPEIVETMYHLTFEDIDRESWGKMHAAGLDIPPDPEITPLHEGEQAALLELATYVQLYEPSLMKPLGLAI